MKKCKAKTLFIALVVFLLIGLVAACANDEPVAAPEALPEDIPAAVDDTPAPPPEPEPEPVVEPPSNWQRVDVFGVLSVEVSKDWIRNDTGDRIIYYFDEGSELPAFAFYTDHVTGFSGDTDAGFDEFFDWWLAERFHNQGLDIISEEFVKHNGVRGLEIVFYDVDDDTGADLIRHSLYSIIGTTYVALTFRFEKGSEGPYDDDVAHVFGSMLLNHVSLEEWPEIYLPEGTPEYKDGEIDNAYASVQVVNININNTSKDVLLEYYDLMKNAGWDIEIVDPELPGAVGTKGQWDFNGWMQSDGTTLALSFSYNE